MTGSTNKDFWRWLGDELAKEAHQARESRGRLPPKPVCLSEVEAVGLLVLAYDAGHLEPPGGLAAGAARWLVDTLQGHLDQLGTDHGSGMG
jgi:hypothetical protein